METMECIPTGFTKVDELLDGGLQRGELTLLTSTFTAMGKTSLATSIVRYNALETENTITLFTLEGREKDVMTKLVAMESGVDSRHIYEGSPEGDEHTQIRFTFRRFRNNRLWVSEHLRNSVAELRSQLPEEKQMDCIIVDYLELLRDTDEHYSQVLVELKQLAQEMNSAVLAVFQSHTLQKQRMTIGKDFDALLLLDRQNQADRAQVTVLRNNEIGLTPLYFYAPTPRFFKDWEEYRRVYHREG